MVFLRNSPHAAARPNAHGPAQRRFTELGSSQVQQPLGTAHIVHRTYRHATQETNCSLDNAKSSWNFKRPLKPEHTHTALSVSYAAAALGIMVFAACIWGTLSRPVAFLASFWPANALMLGLLLRRPELAQTYLG